MISIKNCSFAYKGTEQSAKRGNILSNISLEIKQGEFLTLIGGNGSGKSTLLKMLNAILIPDNGSVTIFGMNTKDSDMVLEIRKKIGFVFQNPENQIIASTVEEDVVFGMENLGFSRDIMKKRLKETLTFVGLQGCEKRNPMNLSGGQKQRLAIASALVLDPEILLLDEPLSMLDPEGQRDIFRLIRKYHENNKTVILITHDMEAAAFSEKICFIRNGRIEKYGTPSSVIPRLKKYEEIECSDWVVEHLKHRGRDSL